MNNWDDLKFILALQREGSLSGAARALNVNHATVSRRLALTEKRMGVRLFDRHPSGMTLTDHGQKAVEAASQIEKHILELNIAIAAKDSELAGPLKISAPQLIVELQLIDIIKDFREAYPQIDLSIVATSDMVNLFRREADVSIRAVLEPDNSLWGQRVLRQNCMYYASRHYMESRCDLQALDCLNFPWRGDHPTPEILEKYPHSRVVAKFDDMVAMRSAIIAGLGVSRMPCFIGDHHPALVRIPDIAATPYHDIWILTHPDLKNVPRIQHFMAFAARHLRQQQDHFLGQEKTPA